MDYDKIYTNEVYLGDYIVEWVDQKLIIKCTCEKEPSIEVFSDVYSACEECGRRYSIVELIKVEVPAQYETNSEFEETEFVDLIEQQANRRTR